MENRTLSLAAVFLFTFLFMGSFNAVAEETEAPTDCCLPVVEKEAFFKEKPLLEARAYMEPGGNGGPFPFPTEPQPRPSKKGRQSKERSIDLNDQTWNEKKYGRGNRWTLEDTFYQTQYTLLHILDWGQTRYIAGSDEFYEMNPILGANPRKGEVDLYFSITLISHTAISFVLPRKWRRKWQLFWIGLESFVTINNSAAGVSVDF